MSEILNSKVLVLNRSYLPVHITSLRRALTLLYCEIALAVDGEYRTFDFPSWRKLVPQGESIGLVHRGVPLTPAARAFVELARSQRSRRPAGGS